MLLFAAVKQFLAYLFLFIFSFQVLPVKELGKLLAGNTMTEEVQHDCDWEPGGKMKKEGDSFLPPTDTTPARSIALEKAIAIIVHHSDGLPDYHVPDILTPPPNC